MAESPVIYSISQNVPLGEGGAPSKNYYINLGEIHGVTAGTKLEVFRLISRTNPYESNKRINFKVPVGMLNVIHSEQNDCIAELSSLNDDQSLFLELNSVMIGDSVDIKINKN